MIIPNHQNKKCSILHLLLTRLWSLTSAATDLQLSSGNFQALASRVATAPCARRGRWAPKAWEVTGGSREKWCNDMINDDLWWFNGVMVI